MKLYTWANLAWLVIYFITMAVLVSGLLVLRQWSLNQFSTSAAQDDWQEWQLETARQAAGDGPVHRREAKSPEPPTLTLMRDHFMTMVATAVFFGTLLFFTLMIMLRGALATSSAPLVETGEQPKAGRE